MIERWERLGQTLEDQRKWTSSERDEAIRLQGYRPDFDGLRERPIAWLTWLYTMICNRVTPREELEALFDPHRYPEAFHNLCALDALPDFRTCFDWLREVVADHLYSLHGLETAVRTRYEEPDRAEASSRCLILADPSQARLFLRYHAEARTSFHRAYRELMKALEIDAMNPAEEVPDVPESPPPAPEETVSPNEANSGAKPDDIKTKRRSKGPTKSESTVTASVPGVAGGETARVEGIAGSCNEPIAVV